MLLCSGSMAAEVVLPRIYTDNMVLQHDSEVLLPGTAVPGSKVTVNADWPSRPTKL